MKSLTTVFLACLALLAFRSNAQGFQSADTVKAPADYENIYMRKLYSDSLVSSFVIYVKKEVKAHKHVSHSEHVYVLEGNGETKVGDKKFRVKRGDVIFI